MDEAWIAFFKEFGFPAVMVGIMLAAIYRLGAWFAKNVATPLADSHIALVSQLAKSDQMKTDILSRLEESQAASDARSERNHAEIIGTQMEIVSILKKQFDTREMERNR